MKLYESYLYEVYEVYDSNVKTIPMLSFENHSKATFSLIFFVQIEAFPFKYFYSLHT